MPGEGPPVSQMPSCVAPMSPGMIPMPLGIVSPPPQTVLEVAPVSAGVVPQCLSGGTLTMTPRLDGVPGDNGKGVQNTAPLRKSLSPSPRRGGPGSRPGTPGRLPMQTRPGGSLSAPVGTPGRPMRSVSPGAHGCDPRMMGMPKVMLQPGAVPSASPVGFMASPQGGRPASRPGTPGTPGQLAVTQAPMPVQVADGVASPAGAAGGAWIPGTISDVLFEAVDQNHDGVISRAEFRNALKNDIVRPA